MDERTPAEPDLAAGLPITQHHYATPEGQIESWGLLADGLNRQRGWRRTVAKVVVIVGVVAALLGVGILAVLG